MHVYTDCTLSPIRMGLVSPEDVREIPVLQEYFVIFNPKMNLQRSGGSVIMKYK